MKKILIFGSPLGGKQEVNEEVNTWGELKTILVEKGIIVGNMKAVVRELQSEFVGDSATLPSKLGKNTNGDQTHDFTLFLSIKETKSGTIK